ncbi:MAG: sulfatase-like hydrolase/transferase [Myxococcota bacterium]|nr:sulfatase-like hydrolase/transferase [Myxococcota bacterium]
MKRAACCFLAALGLACAEAPRPEVTNLVVISLDTTRADHLGLYGYFRDTSPHLDAFAKEAIVFDQAFAPMATTLPTHASLFTGTYPLEHGVLANLGHGGSRFEPQPGLRSVASVARDTGYRTGAFVSAAPLKPGSGIEDGFEAFAAPGGGEVLRRGDATVDDALDWLAREPEDEPFFLWVHLFDAHWPFAVPEPEDGPFRTDAALERWIADRRIAPASLREGVGEEASRATHNRYDAALRFQDLQLGRLLDALESRSDWDRTAVVIVGDHGEGLSQHGHAAHGRSWNEQLQVPLLLRLPGEPPRRVDDLVSLVDVLPTLIPRIDAPGLEPLLAQMTGRDALAGGNPTLFAQDTGRVGERPGYRYALTTPRWKYFRIETRGALTGEELYDRRADPFELEDVAAQHPQVVAQLREALLLRRKAQRERAAALRGDAPPPVRPVDPELREQLRMLGYVDGDSAEPDRPNLLLVVWDTVRADHLGLYGYERDTTPRLDAWAEDALVFDDALASASSTVPTHASLFTGRLPSEHGSHAGHQWLDDELDTLAERLQRAGYRTYLWSSNPHLSAAKNFTQGFDQVAHPWDAAHREAARQLVLEKLPSGPRGQALRTKLESGDATWPLASAGALASEDLERFIAAGPADQPWFAFVNYMEAHRPYLPPEANRRLFLSEEDTQRSYALRDTWPAVWGHVFGVARYSDADLALTTALYDAALRELDDLFADLLAGLAARGELENTVVALTADHGELLGEHGLLDHQYSLYQPLLHVPLVLWAPGRVVPGRSRAPVMALDIRETLLALAGAGAEGAPTLLAPPDSRTRLAEYPAIFARPFRSVGSAADATTRQRLARRLRAVVKERHKLIEGEDGAHELYALSVDPDELQNLASSQPELRERLRRELYAAVEALAPAPARTGPGEGPSEAQAALLAELGYAETPRDAALDPPAFDAPSSWQHGD